MSEKVKVYESPYEEIWYTPINLPCCRCAKDTAHFTLGGSTGGKVGWHYRFWIRSYNFIDWCMDTAVEIQKFIKDHPELVPDLLEE